MSDPLVLIDKLDDLIHNAKIVPFTGEVRLKPEKLYEVLDQLRASVPEAIFAARQGLPYGDPPAQGNVQLPPS